MFLTAAAGPNDTTRREKSDHATVEEAKLAFAQHPKRKEREALIYLDGIPTWLGTTNEQGEVNWHPWKV